MAISKITDNSLNITDLTIADDLTVTDDLLLASDSAAIKFGADSEITLTHVADAGLILKHVGTGDGKRPRLTLSAGDNDIAVDDELGVISFQAPDEGAGTDAILIGAEIAAVSEGDFSASNNATKLSFRTASSEEASSSTEKMKLSSAGVLSIPADGSDLTGVTNAIHLGASADMKIFHNSGNNYILTDQASQSFTVLSDVVRFNTRDNAESLFGATLDGSFFAKHNNQTKISTTDYGLQVQDDTDALIILKSNESNANSSGAQIQWFDSDDSTNHYIGMPSESNNDFYIWSVASGQFLIGLGNTHRFNIDASGNITASDTNGIGSLSDERLKENVKDFSYSLSDFNKLKPRTFDWKNPDLHGGKEGIGFIAQELESVDTGLTYDYEVTETKIKYYKETVYYNENDFLPKGKKVGDIRFKKGDPMNVATENEKDASLLDSDRIAKATKITGKKDAMYVSIIQQLASKIETLEAKVKTLEDA